jgi:hypothetical protein
LVRSRLLRLGPAMIRPPATHMVIAVMVGWRGPATYHGLTREAAKALRQFFEHLGAAVTIVAE